MRLGSRFAWRGGLTLAATLVSWPAAAQEHPMGWEFGPGARLARSGFEFNLAGYIQGDFRSFHDYENAQGELPDLGAESELRRLRLGGDAKWKRLSVEFDFDPHDDQEHLKNLFADLKITRGLH